MKIIIVCFGVVFNFISIFTFSSGLYYDLVDKGDNPVVFRRSPTHLFYKTGQTVDTGSFMGRKLT